MKRTPLKQVGKKGREWQAAKRKLINEIKNDPNSKLQVVDNKVYGRCPDCKHHHQLTPDHLVKRSLGGGHSSDNIQWVCNATGCWCHSKRDNYGDPEGGKTMAKKERKIETKKLKKADWQKPHKCKECKQRIAGFLLCPNCGKVSV